MGLFNKLFKRRKRMEAEDFYNLTLTENYLRIEHPKLETQQLYWNDIQEIKLINTDEGPWLPDVWLSLANGDNRCLIPQGAVGYDEIYERVSKYEEFNFENVIQSMTCTDNQEFLLWTRK